MCEVDNPLFQTAQVSACVMGPKYSATQQANNNFFSSGYFFKQALPEREGEGIRHLRTDLKERNEANDMNMGVRCECGKRRQERSMKRREDA